ncbi:MAG: hypothetical protein Q9160_004574 [Pyrenula sp. 1 TL-2023]
MALTTTSHPDSTTLPLHQTAYDAPLPPPPAVAITPCDPWPRPYYLSQGLRRVAPYHFTYNTYCKERWRGRSILDIFTSEFRDRPREYYQEGIESGAIVLNGKRCESVHQVVKNGDVISHTMHRHEPPVTAQPIGVISEDADLIVIDKPAGVPVHPAGRYNYNSIVEIMRAERAGTNGGTSWNPLPCNRLDRLTSGVMFIGKNRKAAEGLAEKLRGRTVRKEYLARVKGRFPDGDDEGVVRCEEPVLQISPILGLNRARASGKSAKTLFRRIAYYNPKKKQTQKPNSPPQSSQEANPPSSPPPSTINAPDTPTPHPQTPPPPPLPEFSSGYSIVQCLPLTGRTHQLRVHLQFLGHPISNDPIYSNRRVFGPSLARHDSSPAHDAEIIARLSRMGKTETAASYDTEQQQQQQQQEQLKASLSSENEESARRESPSPASSDPLAPYVQLHDEMVHEYNRKKGEKMTGEKCAVCATELYSDPTAEELGIYLHAVAYSDVLPGGWAYRSGMPGWAMPPEGSEGEEGGKGPREYVLWEGPEG